MEQHPSKAVGMTQIRREVSLDSQGVGSAGSLANSRLTLESLRGDTPVSVKSSFDFIDEGVQVDLSADTITYDSDDEMVKKNRISLILTRNKKGHPIYSREDIREQYCINRKEVEVLESGRSIKFLGCFTNPDDSSTPCSRNSILFSCIHKKKHSNSDENVYMRSKQDSTQSTAGDVTAAPTPTPYDSERTYDDDRKSAYDDRSTDDEEYVLSGFRKRPRTVCQYDPSRAYWMDSESIPGDVYIRRRKLESSASIGSTSQHSAIETERDYGRDLQRPSQLVIDPRGRTEIQYIQGSHSVDELNDVTAHRTIIVPRVVKTPDISLDDRRPKHVSFDNGSLVRSNTVGGGLEDVVYVAELESFPAATSTPLNAHRRAFSPPAATPRNRSKERLLDRSVRHWSDLGDRVAVSSSTMTTIAIKPDQNLSYRVPHRPRRAMKTQATQTELTFRDRFSLPAYLTLSPRAHKTSATQAFMPPLHPSKHRSRSASKHKSASSKISKSKSAYEYLNSEEDTEEDVMEVDLSGKQHRLVRAASTRASIRRQRAFDTSQEEEEEIMVSFKPAQSPPRRPIEVLIGDRPVPRLSERERKSQSAIAREQTMEGFRQLKEATAAATSALKQSQKPTGVTSDTTRLKKESVKKEEKPSESKPEKPETIKSVPGSTQTSVSSTVKQASVSTAETSKKVPMKSKSSDDKQSTDDVSEPSGLRTPSGTLIGFKSEAEALESTSVKSSSGSSKHISEKPDSQTRTTGSSSAECQISGEDVTNPSEESSTMTTEGSPPPEVVKAQMIYQEKRQTYLAKYQQQKKEADMHMESPTSPDTESSSSIFTERETSRSEVSTSSSNNRVAKSDSESSDYVTAPDHSHKEGASPGSQKKKTEDTHTSFESFSSPSSRSSQRQGLQKPQKSSTSPSSSASLLPYDDVSPRHGDADQSAVSKTKINEVDDGSVLSPPVLQPPNEGEEHLESSDESTKKESSRSSETDDGDTADWRCKLAPDGTSGTPDSDRTSDITPVFDASPEPLSSLQEEGVETVIELRSETATTTATTSDEFPESLNNEGSVCHTYLTSSSNNGDNRRCLHHQSTESESSESSCVLSGFQDGDMRFCSELDASLTQSSIYQPSEMKPSEELSTVSEVSEESSQGDNTNSRKFHDRKHSDFSSPSDNQVSGDRAKKSSSSEYIPSEATTSSFDSTTSGSFILENGSCTSSTNNSGKSGSECSSKKGDQETTSNSETTSRRTFDTGSESFRLAETMKDDEEEVEEQGSAQELTEEEGEEEGRIESETGIREYDLKGGKKLRSKHIERQVSKQEELGADLSIEQEKSKKTSPSPPSSTNSEKSEKLATASSTTPFSSSPTSSLAQELRNQTDHEQDYPGRRAKLSERPSRSRSVEEPEHSLSAWCSEGAIPKQKTYEGGETKRRRERMRVKSESKEHPPHLQLVPPEHHRHHPRSKSHSPDKSEEDDQDTSSAGAASFGGPPSKKVLCSQCGEKIKETGAPLSAPPPGMWERQYPRAFWEPLPGPPPPHHHHHHHHHQQQQSYLWRQQQQQKLQAPGFGDAYPPGPPSRYAAYAGTLARSWSTECGPAMEADLYPDEDEDAGIHSESYRTSIWIYVTESDELAVWEHPIDRPQRGDEFGEEEVDPSFPSSSMRRYQHPQLTRSDSSESTSSEHDFLRQYQAVTHRMIHRKSSVEMYDRIAARTFEVDKRVTVQRNNGEFGFRIHGSKPVVVSAIERGTPAETCGLEVGDIIVCINGMNVLDASHSEVVRIAHTGTEVLKMEVTRTCHRLAPVLTKPPPPPAFAGFLQRLSARSVTGRRWCRRWFAVREDGVLYWYRTSKDHEPLGALVLQNHNISRVPDAGSPHAFKVSRIGGCPYYFSADDEDTATRWISALNQVASNASRVDPFMDQCVRNAQLPASAVVNPDCEGYLAKLSQRWKSWKRRYFVLKDAALFFYVDRNAKVALGLFHLHGYKVQSCSLQGKKNTFEAIPPEPRLKHLYFQADSENEKKRWLAALEYSIDRWIKVG